MKKVTVMLALVALVGNIANAELLKNFKADGQIEVNAYSVNNKDFNKKASDKTANTDTRIMINAGFDLNEDVNAVVSAVKLNRQYGTGSENISYGTGAGGGIFDNVFFQQAYLNLKNVLGIDHKLGRQYYGDKGDMVIYYGPATMPYTAKFTPSIAAIDGWTGWYKFTALNRDWNLNAIIAKQVMGTTYPSRDINVSGINAKTNVDRWNLNAYVYQKVDQNNAVRTDYLDVVGARANWECMFVKNLNLGLEYDRNMGKNLTASHLVAPDNINYKHQGYAYKVNADYGMDLAGKLGFMGQYYFASGDKKANAADTAFKAINSDYRPGIINGGGYTGTITNAGTGSVIYGLGANWTPEKLTKLNIAANYYNFSYAEKKVVTVPTTRTTNMGNESDLVLTWTHSDNVNVKGYYAMFQPEKKNLAVNAKHDAETMMGAAFNVKF